MFSPEKESLTPKKKKKKKKSDMLHHWKREADGTYSGRESTVRTEEWCIFVDACFMIEGYYKVANERELLEMLFLEYEKNGRVVRRIFSRCSFSFIGLSEKEICSLMYHLVSDKPGGIQFGFYDCQVLSNGAKLEYYFPEPSFMIPREIWTIPGIVHWHVFSRYNLKEARIEVRGESKAFSDAYQWRILTKRMAQKVEFDDFQVAMTLAKLKEIPEKLVSPYRILIENVDRQI